MSSHRDELRRRSRHLADTAWYDGDEWQADYIHTPTRQGCRIYDTEPGLTGYRVILKDGGELRDVPPELLEDADQLPLF